MGFDINGVKFLLTAKASGVCFTKVMTIGRQELRLDFDALKKNLRSFHLYKGDTEVKRLLSEEKGQAEPLLRMLGAIEICSLDVSPYEGASLIHDLNQPIPEELKNAFTVVIDGGSLEHIFDFPTAIKNCLQMIQVGGHFLGISPTNNFMGHGFYQFSPELYFRIFKEKNGWKLEKMIIFESSCKGKWYEVIDPETIQKRVELVNKRPTYLLVQAKKIENVDLFSSVPMQSDYVTLWRKHENSCDATQKGKARYKAVFTIIKKIIPRRLRRAYRNVEQVLKSRFDPEFFKKIPFSVL